MDFKIAGFKIAVNCLGLLLSYAIPCPFRAIASAQFKLYSEVLNTVVQHLNAFIPSEWTFK